MSKKNKLNLIILILAALLVCTSCSKKMTIPSDVESIIDTSIRDLVGADKDEMIRTILSYTQYEVVSQEATAESILVTLVVRSRDVDAVLNEMYSENTVQTVEEFNTLFNERLLASPENEQRITVEIIKENNQYTALFDEASADAFLGGFIAYVDNFINQMSDSNEE